jgi:hypothetical protein
MPHPCPHHCPPSGGGLGRVVIVIVIVGILALSAASRPVVHAVTGVLEVLAIVLAVILGLAVTAAAAVLGVRVHRWRAARTVQRSAAALPLPSIRVLPPTPRKAIEAPREVHPHGVSAEAVAAIIGRQGISAAPNPKEQP